MFNNRFKFILPGLLGLYSFWNIVTLEGDRLFQADLPIKDLFCSHTSSFLCSLVGKLDP